MLAEEEQDSEATSPMYIYESKIHCSNVLLSLEEQWRQEVLCDVTVLVEGRKVRAHRAVLAASSRYFLQALLGHNRLPREVTAKGFAPLLQFAYTAKLVLSQENIHDVILCADFLGVHNLEDSCFRFLQEQLQNDSQQAINGMVDYDEEITAKDTVFSETTSLDDSGDARHHVASTSPLPTDLDQCSKSRKAHHQISDINGENHPGSDDVILANNTSVSPVRSQNADSSATPHILLASSRIKEEFFVFEEGKENNCCNAELGTEEVLEMELEVEEVPVATEHLPNQGSPPSCLRSYIQRGGLDFNSMPSATIQQLLTNRLSLNHHREIVKDRQRDKRESGLCGHVNLKTDAIPAGLCGNMEIPVFKASSSKLEGELDRHSVIFSSLAGEQQLMANSYIDKKFREKVTTLMQVERLPLSRSCHTNSFPVPIRTSAHSPPPFELRAQTSISRSSFSYPGYAGSSSSPSSLPHFDFSSSPHLGCISGLSQCPRTEQSNPDAGEVVFSQGCTKIKSERGFGASVGNSSDESGSFSEGDSESGMSRVSGPEVKLPFPVDQITNLPRTDFQILIKLHKLNSEQLEFIHDIRRRSKNRIAAQRCRKRKLDCIQNLEGEIRKLMCEKEKLMSERNQLKVCMSELWQNLAFLSQQVCREVQGSQLPPISSSINLTAPSSDDISSQPRSPMSPMSQQSEAVCLSDVCLGLGWQCRVEDLGQKTTECELVQTTEETCSPTVTVDFCQEMTEKCTTEEQERQDCS
uniref:BTB and CNC homology 1, basic leucine zipper transcription factor 2b n=1 Tax=Echeneis naucrates TaxID=173247 RepID=A0A665WE26_ECHNA